MAALRGGGVALDPVMEVEEIGQPLPVDDQVVERGEQMDRALFRGRPILLGQHLRGRVELTVCQLLDSHASAGNGTLPHVSMELLLRRTGIEVAHIPYRGAAPAMTDLLAGQVQLKMDTYATANQLVADSKLRALAYASRARSTLMPNVPTVAEMGLPGYEGILWIGMMAPAGTPRPVIDKLAIAAQRATRAPDLAERLKRDGVDPAGGTPRSVRAR